MPKGVPEDTCGDYGGKRNNGEPCGRAAGWGTPESSGRCRACKGTLPDGGTAEDHGKGDQEGNTNATSHGAYTDVSSLYENEFTEREQDLTDQIEADYIDRYTNSNGREPTTGEALRIFKMAVNAVTEMRVENWYTDKPDTLQTGTPLIDRETHISESGQTYYRYKKSPAAAARKHLESYNRQWGKTMGLFDDPESQKADAMGELKDLWKADLQG